MATYVLVHGGNLSTDTWNTLAKRNDYPSGGYLGGKLWDTITPALEAQGHIVFAPTLQDENSHSLTDHIEQIVQLIQQHNLKNIILVGASYGGMVITGVADKIGDRIALLVYLDAALPEPGQSLFDILALAHIDPVSTTGSVAKAYTEKLHFNKSTIRSIPKLYVLCTKSGFEHVTSLVKPRIRPEDNWKYTELATSHVPQATDPDMLIELLLFLDSTQC